ncbi:hypothetical protein [Sphingomonas profundi]|uniref:hypothetical protein n=1 Tax=Alterirhizorhabdus profundi TaxID=2681549 RepID=UPI001E33B6CA|nr:hypothetical protein [Sphingomonas profundi]
MTETTERLLPQGFEDLEPLVEYWAGEDGQIRWDRRAQAEMASITAFYNQMVSRADAALAYLMPFDLNAFPGPEARLYRLVLSLAHAAMAVELHGQPRAPHSPYPHGIRLVQGPQPFA